MKIVIKQTKEVFEVEDMGNFYRVKPDDNIFKSGVSASAIKKELCTPLIDKITSLDEYQKLAARTLPDLTEFYSGKIMIDNLKENANIVHCMFGVQTELGEILDLYKKSFAYRKVFDKTNLLEEVCDTMWYIAGGCTITKLSLGNFLDPIDFNGDFIPKEDYPTLDIMGGVYDLITNYQNHKITLEELLEKFVTSEEELFRGLTNNINKLIIRYPDKFSTESAINRDLGAERNQLEQ